MSWKAKPLLCFWLNYVVFLVSDLLIFDFWYIIYILYICIFFTIKAVLPALCETRTATPAGSGPGVSPPPSPSPSPSSAAPWRCGPRADSSRGDQSGWGAAGSAAGRSPSSAGSFPWVCRSRRCTPASCRRSWSGCRWPGSWWPSGCASFAPSPGCRSCPGCCGTPAASPRTSCWTSPGSPESRSRWSRGRA